MMAIEERSADFSPCRTYRYRLLRRWADGPMLNVIGLNPSTADETKDDPTIRRCIGFAKSWGYSGLIMTNLCAFRSTDPAGLLVAEHPEGPMNRWWLRHEALASGLVLAAWGAHPVAVDLGRRVMRVTLEGIALHCLGLTQGGAPRHPLYVSKTTQPIPFEAAA
jgi:hypothetical protein